jgi:hypothetical protein
MAGTTRNNKHPMPRQTGGVGNRVVEEPRRLGRMYLVMNRLSGRHHACILYRLEDLVVAGAAT